MTGQLDGQVAIVTGGLGNIGVGVCRALVAAGAQVAALDLDLSSAALVDGLARAIVCDVTDRAACTEAVDRVVRELGTVHTLVNMAQDVVPAAPLLAASDHDMARSFESGPTGSLRMMQLCHPHLKANGGGAIVNFASGAGTDGLPQWGPYASAKEAIRGEWGPDGIRVNVLCPFATSRPDRLPPGAAESNPMGRVGDPEQDVGAMVVFLAGPGRFITGRTLFVDGGATGWR
jgi:NAD(P)-dependent dehydrogenase (short-subunit alcohol dehydrogenase family)